MDTYKWLVEQEQDLLYLVEDWLRSNEMYNEDEETGLEVCTVCNAPVECRCPIEIADDLQQAWDELQAVPSYVERKLEEV